MRRSLVLLLISLLAACGQPQAAQTSPPTPSGVVAAQAPEPSASVTPSASATLTTVAASTVPPTPTASATPTSTAVPPTDVPAVRPPTPTFASTASIRGTVSYPAEPALPADAVLIVQLVNQTDCGVFGCVVESQQIIEPVGPAPIAFEMSYDAADINPDYSYTVEAWLRAPGRLDWRSKDVHPVEPQEEVAPLEIAVAPPADIGTVRGTLSYPPGLTLSSEATLTILMVPVPMDYGDPLGTLEKKLHGTLPDSFILEYKPAEAHPEERYVVYAILRVDDQQIFVSSTVYPVITQGHASTVSVVLQASPAASAISGTIVYSGTQALPEGSKVRIVVNGHLGGDVPVELGKQVVEVSAPGPIPFAIPLAPEIVAQRQIYEFRMGATLPDGTTLALVPTQPQPVFAYLPAELTVIERP